MNAKYGYSLNLIHCGLGTSRNINCTLSYLGCPSWFLFWPRMYCQVPLWIGGEGAAANAPWRAVRKLTAMDWPVHPDFMCLCPSDQRAAGSAVCLGTFLSTTRPLLGLSVWVPPTVFLCVSPFPFSFLPMFIMTNTSTEFSLYWFYLRIILYSMFSLLSKEKWKLFMSFKNFVPKHTPLWSNLT